MKRLIFFLYIIYALQLVLSIDDINTKKLDDHTLDNHDEKILNEITEDKSIEIKDDVFKPTSQPTSKPTPQRTMIVNILPSQPSGQPTSQPTHVPTLRPSFQPTSSPSSIPTSLPTPEGSAGVNWWFVVRTECIFWRGQGSRQTTPLYRAASHVFNFLLKDMMKSESSRSTHLSVQVINTSPVKDVEKNEKSEEDAGNTAGGPSRRSKFFSFRKRKLQGAELVGLEKSTPHPTPVSTPPPEHKNHLERPDDPNIKMYSRVRLEVWCHTNIAAAGVVDTLNKIRQTADLLVTPMHEQGMVDVLRTSLTYPVVVVSKELPPERLPTDPKRLFYVIFGTLIVFGLMWMGIHRMKQYYSHVDDPFVFMWSVYKELKKLLLMWYEKIRGHAGRLLDDSGSVDSYDTDEEDLGLLAERMDYENNYGDDYDTYGVRHTTSDIDISRESPSVELRPSGTSARARRNGNNGV